MVSVGPTTSMRMEKFEYEFVETTGVRVVSAVEVEEIVEAKRNAAIVYEADIVLTGDKEFLRLETDHPPAFVTGRCTAPRPEGRTHTLQERRL